MNDAPGLRRVTKGRRVALAGTMGARVGVVVKANPRSCLVRWDGDTYASAHDCNAVTVLDLRDALQRALGVQFVVNVGVDQQTVK